MGQLNVYHHLLTISVCYSLERINQQGRPDLDQGQIHSNSSGDSVTLVSIIDRDHTLQYAQIDSMLRSHLGLSINRYILFAHKIFAKIRNQYRYGMTVGKVQLNYNKQA